MPLAMIVVRSGMFSWLLSSLVFWSLLQFWWVTRLVRVMAMVRSVKSVVGN